MIFVMKFQAAAMSRASVPENERVDFCLYVDEFQNFSTDSFATIMSEARKYHLNLVVANQFTTQLTDEIRDAVFGNVGSIVSFRVGTADAEALVKKFQPVFDIDDLQRIPNFNTITQTIIGGVPSQPFSMATLPPLGNPNKKLAEALKQLSAAKYGRPRADVEREIFARLSTKDDKKAAVARYSGVDASPGGSSNPNFGRKPSAPAPKPGGQSFLDEWLAKRGANAPAKQAQPIKAVEPQEPFIIAEPTKDPTPEVKEEPVAVNTAPVSEKLSEEVTTSDQTMPKSVEPNAQAEQEDVVSVPNQQPVNTAQDTAVDDKTEIPEGDTIFIDKSGTVHFQEEEQ